MTCLWIGGTVTQIFGVLVSTVLPPTVWPPLLSSRRLRVHARVELVALGLAVGFEQLHGVEVHVERDHDADLLRGLQILLRGLVGVLRADRDLGALGGDVELVGHVPAGLVQVVDAGVGLVGGVLLVDLDVGGVLQSRMLSTLAKSSVHAISGTRPNPVGRVPEMTAATSSPRR